MNLQGSNSGHLNPLITDAGGPAVISLGTYINILPSHGVGGIIFRLKRLLITGNIWPYDQLTLPKEGTKHIYWVEGKIQAEAHILQNLKQSILVTFQLIFTAGGNRVWSRVLHRCIYSLLEN